MVKLQVAIASLAAFALAASSTGAQSFEGDGTAYTLGQVNQGNCNFMAAPAAASQNYAAINNDQWDALKNCGRCAQVSCVDDACADKSVSEVVYIVDRCPECKHGDLDLSPSVFQKITGSSPSRLKISWKFVDCPSPGKLQYCLKSGSNPYFVAVQPANAAAAIASVKINGQATTMVDSAFYYVLNSQSPVDLSKVTVSLTSSSGSTVQETVSLSVGSCTAGTSQFGGGSAVTPPASTPKPTTTTPKPTTTTPKPTTTQKPTPKPSTTPKTETGADATNVPAASNSSAPTATPAVTATPVPTSEYDDDDENDENDTPAPAASDDEEDNGTNNGEGDNNDDSNDDESEVSPAPVATPAATPKKTSKNCASKFRRV